MAPSAGEQLLRAYRSYLSQDQDVIGTLESIAEDVMTLTGFFRNGSHGFGDLKVQNGVARTNCIDCLDRTNAAQFVIGKRALSHQLHALGIIDDTSMDYDTDAVNLFTEMLVYSLKLLTNTCNSWRPTGFIITAIPLQSSMVVLIW